MGSIGLRVVGLGWCLTRGGLRAKQQRKQNIFPSCPKCTLTQPFSSVRFASLRSPPRLSLRSPLCSPIARPHSIIIFCFGTCVAYIVAVGDILQEGVLDLLPSSVGLTREMLMIIFTGIVMFPLSLNSRINSLRYSSLFGICSIFFLVFVAAYHSITALLTDGWSQSWGSSEVELWAGSFRDIVRSVWGMKKHALSFF